MLVIGIIVLIGLLLYDKHEIKNLQSKEKEEKSRQENLSKEFYKAVEKKLQ